jgi:hypothetical protein
LRLDKNFSGFVIWSQIHQGAAMATKDPRIDAYISKSADFAKPILKHLRKVVHAGCPQVQEAMKWSMPHFDYKGVMCGMAAFKEHCAFGFWKADLILDRSETAEKSGMGSFGCIKSLKDLPNEKRLIGYVKKAAALNEAGIKALGRTQPKKRAPIPFPDYFAAALKKNAKARKTFENFPRAIGANISNGSPKRNAKRPATKEWRRQSNGSRTAKRGTGNTCLPLNSGGRNRKWYRLSATRMAAGPPPQSQARSRLRQKSAQSIHCRHPVRSEIIVRSGSWSFPRGFH